jgi:hypothetical protein
MANRPRPERLVVVDQRDDVAAGDIAIIDDREARRVEVETDVGDLARGDRRADGAAVQQIRERDVVDVPCRAGHLLDAFLAKDVATDRFCDARGHRADYMGNQM